MKQPSEITRHITITDDDGNRIGEGTISIPITYGKPEAHGDVVHVPIITGNACEPANGERVFSRDMVMHYRVGAVES
jgi:hypothetical protein